MYSKFMIKILNKLPMHSFASLGVARAHGLS